MKFGLIAVTFYWLYYFVYILQLLLKDKAHKKQIFKNQQIILIKKNKEIIAIQFIFEIMFCTM